MINIELLYDAPDQSRTSTPLSLPNGSKLRDALRAVKARGFKLGYMQVWLNMEPLHNPAQGLSVDIPDKAVLHIKMVDRWEID